MTNKECEVYLRGYAGGLKACAWWRKGTEYVGGPGVTLASAVVCATTTGNCRMPDEVREYLKAKNS